MNIASMDLGKLFKVGDKVDLSIGSHVVSGKVVSTSVMNFSRLYLIKWNNGTTRWINQMQIRTLVKN